MIAERHASRFSTFAPGLPDDDRPDAELFQRFRETRDEVAFAMLVARHTPAVRAVCRSWLRSPADVDDAAQATFLVLIQRLDSIREPAALAAWLYRVAENVARRMRSQSARVEPLVVDIPANRPMPDENGHALVEEIARLPEKYRLPIQLCYDGGLPTAVAARQLGCPTNTLVTRLSRGRDLLLRRLAARGIVLSATFALGATAARGVSPQWIWATAHAALAVLGGERPHRFGVSDRTVSLSQGVARTMIWKNLKLLAAAVMVATGLAGFVIGQWATADGPKRPKDDVQAVPGKDRDAAAKPGPKADDAKPDPTQRRREAVIRMPAGTFVKDVEVAPYGTGRISWSYEDEKVHGLIEGNVMGVEFEIETDSEISLSSNGTIYGLVNSVKVKHLKFGGELAQAAEYAKFLPLVEPLINELFTDLPFSYQFRVKGDRLTILSFRALMSGPNPLMKLAPLGLGDLGEAAAIALYLQAFGTAMEGTYVSAEGTEKTELKRRPVFRKPTEVPKTK